MSEIASDPPAPSEATVVCDCPPLAERSPEPAADPRAALLQLAAALTHTRSHRLLIEYLRLRRSLR